MRKLFMASALGCVVLSASLAEAREIPKSQDRATNSGAEKTKAVPLFDAEKVAMSIERYVGERRYGALFRDDYISDQIHDGIGVRDALTPYLMPDGNFILSGSRVKDITDRAAVLFDPKFNVIGIAIMTHACANCEKRAQLTLLSTNDDFHDDDFTRWANLRTSFGFETRRLSIQSFGVK